MVIDEVDSKKIYKRIWSNTFPVSIFVNKLGK